MEGGSLADVSPIPLIKPAPSFHSVDYHPWFLSHLHRLVRISCHLQYYLPPLTTPFQPQDPSFTTLRYSTMAADAAVPGLILTFAAMVLLIFVCCIASICIKFHSCSNVYVGVCLLTKMGAYILP